MRRNAVTAVALAAIVSLASACAHRHETLPWPPPAEDIARINEAAAATGGLAVHYVRPIGTAPPVRGGDALRIESIDDTLIAFRSTVGAVVSFPSETVRGVTVKDRLPGVIAGGGLGAAAGAVVAALPVFFACTVGNLLPDDDPDTQQESCISRFDAEDAAIALAAGLAIGVVAGYLVGGRRTFTFGRVR
jgi:hypothetical protein